MMNAEDNPQTAEPAASGPARKRGVLLLKIWGAVYGLVIIAYIVFLASGSTDVAVSKLTAGQRLWNNEVLMVKGERIEVSSGDTISPALLATIHSAYAEAPDQLLTVYQQGGIYQLPFPAILGILNFFGLAILLYMLAGDSLPDFLANHGQNIQDELTEARTAKAEAEALKKQRNEMVNELKAERERLLAAADEEAKREYEYLLAQRQEESERFLKALEHHLGAEIHSAAERLKTEVAQRAVAMAKDKLKDGVGETAQNLLVDDFTSSLKENKLS